MIVEIGIGSLVQSTMTGAMGVVCDIREPEDIGLPEEYPIMVLVATEADGSGFVHAAHNLRVMRAN